ncbi:MAG: DUF4446 family protein [Rudaea sp.]
MNLNGGFTLVEFLLFLAIGLIVVWLITLEWRLLRFTRTLRLVFAGRGGADLEQVLREYLGRMDRTDQSLANLSRNNDQTLAALDNRMGTLERQAPLNLQHVGVIRFNPYADKGGDQSFAIAVLDDRGDGVVLNGLHARDFSRVYAKPVVGGNSTYKLTEEEKEAINRAMAKK